MFLEIHIILPVEYVREEIVWILVILKVKLLVFLSEEDLLPVLLVEVSVVLQFHRIQMIRGLQLR